MPLLVPGPSSSHFLSLTHGSWGPLAQHGADGVHEDLGGETVDESTVHWHTCVHKQLHATVTNTLHHWKIKVLVAIVILLKLFFLMAND